MTERRIDVFVDKRDEAYGPTSLGGQRDSMFEEWEPVETAKGKTSAEIEAELEAEPAPEPEPTVEPEPEPEPAAEDEAPNLSANKSEWVDYAESKGIDTTDMTKDEIIKAVEGA